MARAGHIERDDEAYADFLAPAVVNICDQDGGTIPTEPTSGSSGGVGGCVKNKTTGQVGFVELVTSGFDTIEGYRFHILCDSDSTVTLHDDLSDFELCEQTSNVIGVENTAFCAVRDLDGLTGHIEIIRNETGEIADYVFHPFGAEPVSLGKTLAGYSPCDNGKQFVPKQLWVADPASPFCDQQIFMCVVRGVPDGQHYVCNGDATNPLEELPVGILTTPYQPSGDKVCAETQAGPVELLPGATTVADIVAANLPADFDFSGTAVPVTTDDVSNITITPKACGTQNSAGEEVTIDFVNIDGIAASQHVDDQEGGVNGATAVEVPAGGCAVVTLCFKSCLSKQEIAALG